MALVRPLALRSTFRRPAAPHRPPTLVSAPRVKNGDGRSGRPDLRASSLLDAAPVVANAHAGAAGSYLRLRSFSNAASSRMATPSDLALSYFEPGSAPTTT